jgi:hypothetical protein
MRKAGSQAVRPEAVEGQEELDEGAGQMIARRSGRGAPRLLLAVAAIVSLLAMLAGAPSAFAEAPAPHWKLESHSAPTILPPNGKGLPGEEALIIVTLSNLGSADANGKASQVKVSDQVPDGLEITHVEATSKGNPRSEVKNTRDYNSITKKFENPGGFGCSEVPVNRIECTYEDELPPYEQLEIYVKVKVPASLPPASNEVTVTGGGAPASSLSDPLGISEEATKFGVQQYELTPETEDGSLATQAGAHPYQMTTTFNLNQTLGVDVNPLDEDVVAPTAPALDKSVHIELPPGLVGNPNVVAQCAGDDFGALDEGNVNSCPADTAIGVATVTFNDPIILGLYTATVPVFNLVPAKGEPARFGFMGAHVPVVLDTSLRPTGGYNVTVSVDDASESVQLLGSRVTIWGVPDEPIHNEARGWSCLGWNVLGPCEETDLAEPKPFLTLPTSCAVPPSTTATGESWPNPETGKISHFGEDGEGEENTGYTFPSALTGCELLGFAPTISVEPETKQANTPTGLTVKVKVPQKTTLEATGLAESAVKDTTVVFPEGVLLNPSAANGLEACREETELSEGVVQGGVGFTGKEEVEGTPMDTFTENFDMLPPEHPELGMNFCPDGSKVGVVHIKSPDLPIRLPNGKVGTQELEGGVYLASQNANPFGSLFAMYIVAEEPESGVRVKLAGEIKVNAQGQITSTFENTPDVPFEELKLELFGGPRASLTTPPSCGAKTTTASFTPWSGSEGDPGTVTDAPTFEVTSGCPSPQPFEPSFVAGSTNSQAGAFTPFTLTIGVPQADSALQTVSNMQLPEGLAALLGSVPLCPEPQAEEGTCGEESMIGISSASSGLGSDPYTLPGKVYLTGPYDGAPFGLSAVTPAKAGPFNLGTVVVRSSISVNEYTAAATINTEAARFINYKGESSEFAGLPEFVEGVPSQIKQLNVTVDRPDFEFNPTNCSPMSVTATLKGATGSKAVESPFQASNCASLPFEPKLTASVVGKGSKADGTTFSVKVESPGLGQANIHKVDLTIPSALPSRLTTIQKACPEAVFYANPATCDEGSVIGEGIVHTPVFKNPLKGPAYLVSHGGAEFPDVEFVLQGEGVTVVVDGKTYIHDGVTYSKFETAPDAPFTSFETILPAGPHSALTPNVPESEDFSLCKTTLTLPTEITGQNGAFISQTTPVVITGCGKSGVLSYTKRQLLEKALKACRTKFKAKGRKSKRLACEKAARKKYGAKAAKKVKKKKK